MFVQKSETGLDLEEKKWELSDVLKENQVIYVASVIEKLECFSCIAGLHLTDI